MSTKNKLTKSNIITKNFSREFSKFLSEKKYSNQFILVDDNTVNYCLPVLLREVKALESAHIVEIFSGEEYKNIESVESVWEQLTELNADRRSVLINLGGGMIGDLGGFAAATYKRGIDFIHVPTTLLSQADAAYGGKQGIDFLHYKNQVGVFKDPVAIFVNTEFLSSLPAEQVTNGFAEVVKHALLAGGKSWKRVSKIDSLSAVKWKDIVSGSIEIKLSVVEEDPYEKGLRKILNFGHTLGHAIESQRMRDGEETFHGYCIAAGMIGELFLSHQLCGLSWKKVEEAVKFIRSHFPHLDIQTSDDDKLLNLMMQDKKNRAGRIQCALLRKIGEPVINVEAKEDVIRASLNFIREH